MKYLAIVGVWLAIFVGDGIIFPALTGLPSGFGIIVLLSALVITFGIHRWLIGLGLIFAGLTELILGAYFGTIIGAWLIIVWGWYLLNQFLNLKLMNERASLATFVSRILFGLGLFVLGESVLWMIIRFVYEPELTITILINILRSPTIFSIVLVEFAVTFFVFRFIYSSKNA